MYSKCLRFDQLEKTLLSVDLKITELYEIKNKRFEESYQIKFNTTFSDEHDFIWRQPMEGYYFIVSALKTII